MKKTARVLAVITARGGSQRLKNKNLRPLGGRPLMAYTIRAALTAPGITRTIVSTDSPAIARAARACGAEVPFMRPAHLARDTSRSLDVLQHAVRSVEQEEGRTYDVVVLLQPTSPLRTGQHITQALELFDRKKAETVFSVCAAEHSPYWALGLERRGTLAPLFGQARRFVTRSQDLPAAYRLNGAIYIYRRNVIRGQRPLFSPKTFGYVMTREHSVDIDDALDFAFAEFLMGRMHAR